MLCCLIACRSRWTTSRQVNSTPSIRLTTIRTYGSIGELARLDSSSTTPSSRSSTVTGNGVAGGHPLAASVPCGSSIGLRRRGRRDLAALAAGIEPLLLRFPGRRLVVRGAPLAGTLPAMVLAGSRTDNASSADLRCGDA